MKRVNRPKRIDQIRKSCRRSELFVLIVLLNGQGDEQDTHASSNKLAGSFWAKTNNVEWEWEFVEFEHLNGSKSNS